MWIGHACELVVSYYNAFSHYIFLQSCVEFKIDSWSWKKCIFSSSKFLLWSNEQNNNNKLDSINIIYTIANTHYIKYMPIHKWITNCAVNGIDPTVETQWTFSTASAMLYLSVQFANSFHIFLSLFLKMFLLFQKQLLLLFQPILLLPHKAFTLTTWIKKVTQEEYFYCTYKHVRVLYFVRTHWLLQIKSPLPTCVPVK